MKLGQMASYLDEGLPEPLRMALAELRSSAPPMSRELAADVVRSELGAAPEDVFVDWDPDPIAAASVHHRNCTPTMATAMPGTTRMNPGPPTMAAAGQGA